MDGVLDEMKVNILTISQNLYEGEVKEAVLPGADGEFSIMDFHQPCLARLIKGEIRLSVSGSRFAAGTGHRAPKTERFFIKNGIARVVDNRLTLLVEK